MTEKQQLLVNAVDAAKNEILAAERWLWEHPQTGYTEWQAHDYLKEKFEALGYTLTLAGDIPGFITDVDTGRPGPKVVIFGELDALEQIGHPCTVNGMAHSCGHNAQGAALLGVAAALKAPGALDGLCGSIRLCAVPAEEMIQLSFREELRKKGTIRYMGGKPEFMARGLLDGVDIAMMVHAGGGDSPEEPFDFACGKGSNGCIAKTIVYKGKAAHAGGAPHMGVNAQYAASLGLAACNALRETFPDHDHIRFHPILMGANCAVNIIPDRMAIESYVRGATQEAINRENRKLNRALAGAALAVGAQVELHDRPGYAPEFHDPALMKLTEECCAALVGADHVRFHYDSWGTASSDFGDITSVMPGVQFTACGAVGVGHSVSFAIAEPERLCLNAAKAQLLLADALLKDDAAAARSIVQNYKPAYPSMAAYLAAIDAIFLDKEAVVYHEDGSATVEYANV